MRKTTEKAIPKAPLRKKLGYLIRRMALKPMERTINEVVKKRDGDDKS